MLLVVIADLNLSAKGKRSSVGGLYLVQNLEECGFARSVVADDGNMFPPFDLEAYILEEGMSVKLFGEPFNA